MEATRSLPLTAPELRIGDAERKDAAEQLQEHFAAGRLTWEELDERLGQAWAARTHGELAPLFADLPVIRLQLPPPPPKRRLAPNISVDMRLLWMVVVAFMAIGLVVATRGFVLIPVAWWFFAGRRRGGPPGYHHAYGRARHHPRFPGG